MRFLIIVESPSKCKKIEGYLKAAFPKHSFKCIASVGHFMTLSKRNGIDMKTFKPKFIPSSDKKKVITNLKFYGSKYPKEQILIATDMDREGEKIAYDLYELFKIEKGADNRMVFNEITKKGLTKAFNNLKQLDLNLVNAQIARRVLDRLLGFGISGITMNEVQQGASAGRVISPTTRIIYDREKDIENATDNSSFPIYGNFQHKDYDLESCRLSKNFDTKEEVLKYFKKIQKSVYKIKDIKTTKKKSNPSVPFITSTVNQASPYSVKKTTKLLQDLYQKGHITYIRTDSTVISKDAMELISGHIKEIYGNKYLKVRGAKKKVKGAQEAHECIRPTKMKPVIDGLESDHQKLYSLIFRRTIASQMKEYEYTQYTINISISNVKEIFKTTIDIPIEYGWKLVYKELVEKMKIDKTNDEILLSKIKKGDLLNYIKIYTQEKFQNKYPRYTESKLVKKLEDLGIGRPSTYMMAVTRIQDKQYVKKGQNQGEAKQVDYIEMTPNTLNASTVEIITNSDYNKMILTTLGDKITSYLDKNFNMLIDYNFTANMEKDLDNVAKGNEKWENIVKKYYSMVSRKINSRKKKIMENKKAGGEQTYNEKNRELLGKHKNKEIYKFFSRWGPRIVIGEPGDKNAKYITPEKGIIVDDIDLEKAIQIIKDNEPIIIGKYRGEKIILSKGRYGFYLKVGKSNYGIGYKYKKKNPKELTEEEALDCIKSYQEWKKNKSKKKVKKDKKKDKKIKPKKK